MSKMSALYWEEADDSERQLRIQYQSDDEFRVFPLRVKVGKVANAPFILYGVFPLEVEISKGFFTLREAQDAGIQLAIDLSDMKPWKVW